MSGAARIDGTGVSRSALAGVTVLVGGRTALQGQFMLIDGPALTGVKLMLMSKPAGTLLAQTETDGNGNFQFVGVPAGTHTLGVDASRATPMDPDVILHAMLPIYGVDVTLTAGQVTELPPFQIIPPPPGPTRSIYQPFFGTPMGGIPSKPIPVTLPNDLNFDPGEKAEIWYYDAAPFPNVPGQWRLAGLGTVSEDGSTIVSDEKLKEVVGNGDGICGLGETCARDESNGDGVCETGEICVGIERFCGVCGTTCAINKQNKDPNPHGQNPITADPVNLAIGQMIVEKTDLVLPGRIPAILHRTYNPFDPFGKIAGFELGLGQGWALSVDVILLEESATLRRLILPGDARFSFVRQPDGTFVNTTYPEFAGAVLTAGTQGDHTLRLKDGTLWRFGSGWRPWGRPIPIAGLGLMVEQVDRNGNRLTIERESHARLTRLIEPGARELVFTTDSLGHTTQVTDPLGRTVLYGYNSDGRLETVTDPTGGVTRYTYHSQGRVLTITDARGIIYLTNEYDPATGQVIRQTLADGGVWTFQYLGPAGAPTGVVTTDPRGNMTTQRVSAMGFASETIDALGQATQFERDARGQLLTTTDPLGRVTRFEYDAAGNVTKITDPAGNVRRFEYEPTFNSASRPLPPIRSGM